MKTNCFIRLFITSAVSSAVFFPAAWCADQESTAGPPATPAPGATTILVSTADPVQDSRVRIEEADTGAIVASASWLDIKDCSYAMRVPFFAGLKRLETKVHFQIAELAAKRATMTGTTETKNWDFAMEEMKNARSFLKSMGQELSEATEENWDQRKDKVGQAWTRSQNAYSKVKASTTS